MSEAQHPGTGGRGSRRLLRGLPLVRSAPETEQLLIGVAKGDQAAFAKLYDRISDSVYGLIRRVLRDPAQSEEVTREVLFEVWR